MEFIGLLEQQRSFVTGLSKKLCTVVQCVKEGSLHRNTFLLETLDDEEILAHIKGSTEHLGLVAMLSGREG